MLYIKSTSSNLTTNESVYCYIFWLFYDRALLFLDNESVITVFLCAITLFCIFSGMCPDNSDKIISVSTV